MRNAEMLQYYSQVRDVGPIDDNNEGGATTYNGKNLR